MNIPTKLAEIRKEVRKMIKDNLISDTTEERIATTTVLIWLSLGKREAKKYSKKHVENLDKLGWSKRYKLVMNKNPTDIDLIILILGARGLLQREEGET